MSNYRLTPLGRGLVFGTLFSVALWTVMFLIVVSLVWFA